MKWRFLFLVLCMMFAIGELYATEGYVKVTSSDNKVTWVKILLEYKYNGNQYRVSSNGIATTTEGAVDLDNVWSESGGTGEQYKIIEIYSCAFYNCSKITSVTCSTTGVLIYSQAFQECTSLTSVSIPYAQSIGWNAFAYCSSLKSVTLNSIFEIESGAFYYCTALTSFNIPTRLRTIKENVFQGCTSLTNLTISSSNQYFAVDNGIIYSKDLTTLQVYLPSKTETTFIVPATVSKIANYAFSNNRNLSTVIMQNGVQTIGSNAFYNTYIQSVYLPGSVTSIGNYAFSNSSKLISVKTALSSPVSISDNVFSNASNATLYVPQGSKDLFDHADNWKAFSQIAEYPEASVISFADATVKDICVSNWDFNGDGELDEDEAKEVIEIGTSFQSNTEITSFDELHYFINLKHLTASAFSGCTNLASITVPACLTTIGNYAFLNTAWLNAQPDGLVYIGNVLYSYKGTMPANTKIVVKDGTTSICDRAFYNQTGLIDIELPNSLISIGSEMDGNVFSGCTGLTAIKIPAGIKSIVRYAFYNSGLQSVELPEDLESIGNSSFRSCTSLETIVIPDKVRTIGKNTFRSCTNLLSVTMPSYLMSVATDAFRDCSKLQRVDISNLGGWCNVDFDDARANPLYFAHHLYVDGEELTDFETSSDYLFPYYSEWNGGGWRQAINDWKTIKPYVFYGCQSLKSVSVTQNITSIGNYAFYGCSSLKAVKTESLPFTLTNNAIPTKANAKLYVPKGYLSQYQQADVWNAFMEVKAYPDPDVNEDEEVDVVDVVDIARYVVGSPSDAFVLFLADLNNDNQVNVADAVIEINNVATFKASSRAQEFTDYTADDDDLSLVKNLDNSLSFSMKSERPYTAFQFELSYGTDADIRGLILNEKRKNGHQTIYNKVHEGLYKVVVLSMGNNPFNDTDGELLNMQFDGYLDDNITISNIHFITPNGTDYAFDALNSINGTTGIEDMNKTKNTEKSIFDLQGRKLKVVGQGVNIVNGKKMVIKK